MIMKHNCYSCKWYGATVCTHLNHCNEKRHGEDTCKEWRSIGEN